MIWIIIIVLAAILIGLLVDWPKVVRQRLGKRVAPSRSKQQRPPARKASVREEQVVPFTEPVVPVLQQTSPVTDEEPRHSADPEVEKLLAEADVHFRKGEMKAAEQLYLRAAAADPRCSKAYGRLGVIYLEEGDNWEDAEAAFRQALKTDPNNGFVLNNLGLVLYHLDKYADAIRHFEQAVRHDEYSAARHANLGMAYMAMRQYAKAESSFKKALKLAPNEMEYKDLLNESIEKKKAHKTMIRK